MPCRPALDVSFAHGVLISVCLVLEKYLGSKKGGRELKRQLVSFRVEVVGRRLGVGGNLRDPMVAPIDRDELGVFPFLVSCPTVGDSREDCLWRATNSDNLDASRVSRAAV